MPHPRFRDRVFVLQPLAEVAGDWVDPVSGPFGVGPARATPADLKPSDSNDLADLKVGSCSRARTRIGS